MTTKLVQDGNRIPITVPTGGYTVDKAYQIAANLIGVAPETVAAAGSTHLIVEGVFTLPKVAEAASSAAIGGQLYYRVTGGEAKLTGKATGADGTAGTAWVAATTGATTATVKLAGRL